MHFTAAADGLLAFQSQPLVTTACNFSAVMNLGEIDRNGSGLISAQMFFFTMNVPFNALFRFRFIALATFFG